MKKEKRVGGSLAAALIFAAAFCAIACATAKISVSTPNLAAIPDGTYRGSCDGGLVKATVDVAMSGGRIERVDIVQHICGKGKPAEAIVDEIVREQSLDVDVVTGATRSSLVILKAAENALTRE